MISSRAITPAISAGTSLPPASVIPSHADAAVHARPSDVRRSGIRVRQSRARLDASGLDAWLPESNFALVAAAVKTHANPFTWSKSSPSVAPAQGDGTS